MSVTTIDTLYCPECYIAFDAKMGNSCCPECHNSVGIVKAQPNTIVNISGDVVCSKCNLDMSEADHYSRRGYLHEYPTLNNCPVKDL